MAKRTRTKFDYDADNDVLYVEFGRPQPTEALMVADGVWVRLSLTSGRMVGITFESWKHAKKRLKQIGDQLQSIAEAATAAKSAIEGADFASVRGK